VSRELAQLGTVLGNGAGTLLGGETAAISEETVRLQNAFVEAGLEPVRLEMQRQLDSYLDARLD